MAQEGEIVQQYRKALEMNPDDADTRYHLGISLLREKSYKEALTHLLKVYPGRAGEAETNYSIGLAYAGTGELGKAFEHYKKAEEISPAEAKDKLRLDLAFYNLGVAYQKDGRLDEAVRAYNEAIRINPGEAIAYCSKGKVHYQRKEHDEALQNLTACKEKGQGKKEADRYISAIYLDRGIGHLNQKRYPEARSEFNKAAGLDQENEAVYYYAGYLDYLEGNYKKAVSSLDRIKGTKREDLKKNLSTMFYNIGAGMLKNEDWGGAAAAFGQATSINSADPELHFYLGYSWMKANDFERAAAAFKETLRLDPKHQKAAVNLALVSEAALRSHLEKGERHLKGDSYKEALREFDSALDIDANNRRGLEGKEAAERGIERDIALKLFEGDRFVAEKKYLDARKSYEAVLALDSENPKARRKIEEIVALVGEAKGRHMAVGEEAFAGGRYFKASLEYRAVLALDPGDKAASGRLDESRKRLSELVSPLLAEARKHEDGGSFQEALTAYNKILDIQPDHKEAAKGKTRTAEGLDKAFSEALSKGRTYVRAGDLVKAAEYYEKALDLKPYSEVATEELKAISGKLKKVVDVKLAEASSALKGGRYGEAIANYKTALMVDRGNREAAAGLQNAARLRNEVVEKRMAAGLNAYREGDFVRAIAAFGEVLRIDPGNAEAGRMQKDARSKIDEQISPWLREGEDAYKKGKTEAAAVAFRKALNVDPENRQAKEYMGRIDTQRTKASVAKEIEKYYLSGIELYTAGKYREAIESWKKVLELDPRHEKALLNIEKAKRKMEGVMDTK